jgi:hypothetical protein
MTNSMSKPIPQKPKLQKAFADSIVPLWPRTAWVPDKNNEAGGEKSRSLKLTLLVCGTRQLKRQNIDKNIQDLQSGNARRMDTVETGFLRDMHWHVHCDRFQPH